MTARTEWLSTKEVAEIKGCSAWLIRTRCRVRNRADSIPDAFIDRSGRAVRIHESYVRPSGQVAVPANVTNFRTADEERIAKLVEANKSLRVELMDALTQINVLRIQLSETQEQQVLAS